MQSIKKGPDTVGPDQGTANGVSNSLHCIQKNLFRQTCISLDIEQLRESMCKKEPFFIHKGRRSIKVKPDRIISTTAMFCGKPIICRYTTRSLTSEDFELIKKVLGGYSHG